MRILYHHRIASKDGQFVHVEELVKALRRAGHDVRVVGPAYVESGRFGSERKYIHRLKALLPRFVYELLELAYAIRAYFRLIRAARQYKPDIIYERYNLFQPAGIWLRNRTKAPLLLEVNAPLFEERSVFSGISLKAIASWSERYVWRNADAVLPVTKVLAEYLLAAGVEKSTVTVIPNGVDLAEFNGGMDRSAAKCRLHLDGKLVIGFVGFVREWHRLDTIIRLLTGAEFADVVLLVVGDGPARAELESLAMGIGVVERVQFAGLVERENLLSYMSAFDIALQPSVVPYASPLKIFEYMAMGLAIVAPDTPNIREILVDGETAVLVQQDDIGAMRRKLVQLIGSEELRRRYGKAARQRIEAQPFTWDRNARTVASIGSELCERAATSNRKRPQPRRLA
jgi:glycosyltransferase involved in cell wall biosynthesis